MRRWGKIIFLFTSIFAMCIFVNAFDNESLKIHPFIQSATYCLSCHLKNDKRVINPDITCSQFCLTCHQETKNHHTINIKITQRLPEEFKLTDKKRSTCITCHNPDNARFDNSSWKAESLYEKAFAGKSQYKTYFLIKKNNDGQLCKTCH